MWCMWVATCTALRMPLYGQLCFDVVFLHHNNLLTNTTPSVLDVGHVLLVLRVRYALGLFFRTP